MLCATLCTIKPVLLAWIHHRPLARLVARWCLWSYAIGTLAVLPAIARRTTGIEPTHFIWNLFVAYPLIDRLPLPSILIGEILTGTIWGAQYSLILYALHRIRPRSQEDRASSP